ncbi:hypothetical protein [Ancylobacter defluvii]|uniref:Uncharacterized protein n=1 Tax=Ancylobacter defluvii TaxID=1282440 RepID=A0A9W6JRL8_9HYPH|nr:hypothetical protein [Ancylobacter defluvii]MBS7587302.1 hypothetical protein [Ancylobacter defluvii]GLK81992.1 hypothetical protein GCM10017653_00610 [Ancylobacter defluvii]
MLLASLRPSDLVLVIAFGVMAIALESRTRVDLGVIRVAERTVEKTEAGLITCPLRKPDFATVMQAAVLGDGALIVEQQTRTKVRHIKDC